MLKCKLKPKHITMVYPFVLSCVFILYALFIGSNNLVFIVIAKKVLSENILTLIITIQSALFGFFLTILALLLQMNNKAIDLVKEFGRFNEVVRYSRKAVYSSLIVVVVTVIILITKNIYFDHTIKEIMHYTFGFILFYNALSSFRFVNIFYLLAKSN